MNAKWLIEADVFEDNTDKIIQILKNKGIEHHVLKYIPFDDDLLKRCLDIYGPDECVVFYGSLNFGHKLRKLSWVPGVYLNEKAFECTSYYPALNKELVHNRYVMMPYGDLLNKKDILFNDFFHGHSALFIRPDSGIKQFTGFVCEEDTFEDSVKLAGFYDVEPNLLCLVSHATAIFQEWRFVIVNGNPISGSLYRDWSSPEKIDDGFSTKDYVLRHSHEKREYCDKNKDSGSAHGKDVWSYVEKVSKLYNPDRCWTIDICKTLEGFKVLEIGCFSCAGMYANDLEKVIDSVSKAALEEWEEIYNV